MENATHANEGVPLTRATNADGNKCPRQDAMNAGGGATNAITGATNVATNATMGAMTANNGVQRMRTATDALLGATNATTEQRMLDREGARIVPWGAACG